MAAACGLTGPADKRGPVRYVSTIGTDMACDVDPRTALNVVSGVSRDVCSSLFQKMGPGFEGLLLSSFNNLARLVRLPLRWLAVAVLVNSLC
jgi:hypothetical protein